MRGLLGCAAFAREVDETERELERALAVPGTDGARDAHPAWRARRSGRGALGACGERAHSAGAGSVAARARNPPEL